MNENKNRPTLFAASGLYLLAAIGLWITGLPVALWVRKLPVSYETGSLIVSLIYYLPFLALPVCLSARRRGDVVELLRLNPLPLGSMLMAIVLAILCILIVQDISMLWMIPWQRLGFDVFVTEYVRPESMLELQLSMISGAILAPVGEELLFRGLMMSAWERRGVRRALVVTSLLFAILHGSILSLPGIFFCGMMLGLIVLWTNSLYAGMAFHTVYNAGALALNYLSSAAPADAAEEALMHSDILAYMGGFPTVIMLLVEIALMLMIIGMITRRMRFRYAMRRMMDLVNDNPELVKKGVRFEHVRKFDRGLDHAPMTLGAKLLLALSLLAVLGLFAVDIFSMLGG